MAPTCKPWRKPCWLELAKVVVLGASLVLISSCGAPSRPSIHAGTHGEHSVARIAADLDALSRGLTRDYRATFDAVLANHLAQDAYSCMPPVKDVLAPPQGGLRARRVHGRMPHYGFYYGRMLYRIRPEAGAEGSPLDGDTDTSRQGVPAQAASATWVVELNVAIAASAGVDTVMELPDCELRPELRGTVQCEGIPYPDAPGLDACPDVGRFEATATRHNLRALLRRWSREVEHYYNRDAEYFGLPVRYDFEFFLDDDAGAARAPVDLRLALSLTCARSPYFVALRTGWSLPILAHEMAHFLGLLDEYEMFSGITSIYPKTPFDGAEQSRMGLSMKRGTRLLPLHHYLVLRRYHCREPEVRDPFSHVFDTRSP